MTTDTPRPERVTLTDEEREEVWQGLQRIWAVAPAVERIEEEAR